MSLNSIRKQIERIGDEVEDYGGPGSRVFLVTDSKGRCLSRYLERRDFLDIVWESGARVGNEGLLGRLRRKIEGLSNPIVLLWLGTCDFTEKGRRGKLFIRGLDAGDVFKALENMKSEILRFNSSVRVVFLQCPFYSVKTWNDFKGHPSDDSDDKTLEGLLSTFNKAIDDFNDMYTPKFSLDLEKCTKHKGKPSKFYFRVQDLYTDGIHPGEELSKLWLLKVKKLVMKMTKD